MRIKQHHKLRTLTDLARHLGVNLDFLRDLLRDLYDDEAKLYNSWEYPKPSGGTRPIDAPKENLKFLQKRINGRILQRTRISRVAIGGVRGKRLRDNLTPHVRQYMVANFDLKSFFSNINNRQVYRLYILIGASPEVARALTRLTTFKGRIPQGAPTSPMLANLVAGYEKKKCLDERLQNLCSRNGVKLTRWIDDISMSGPPYLKKFESTILSTFEQTGFIPNREKTAFASKDEAQFITGHLVNSKPNVNKHERKRLRAVLHRFKTMDQADCSQAVIEQHKRSLRGKIAHLASINNLAGLKLLEEFNSISWSN